MPYRITTGPTSEPVTLLYVRNWLKMDEISDDDAIIVSLMAAAREKIQLLSGRALMSQTIEEVFDRWPFCGALELALSPVTAVASIQYRDDNGTYQTLNATNYDVDLISATARIYRTPTGTLPIPGRFANAWKVTYTAGYASAAEVPGVLKTAMAAQVCLDYSQREGYKIDTNAFSNSIDIAIRMYSTQLAPN